MSSKPETKTRPPLHRDVVLDFETESGGVKVGALKMRRPTVNDRMNSDAYTGTELNAEIMMIANLCDVEPDAIKSLYWSDYSKCQTILRELMGFTAQRTI